MGGIKFQHNNLLILVDYLRSQVEQMRTVVKEARDKLEKAKQYETYHLTNTHCYQGRANEEPFWSYRVELPRWKSNMEIVRQCLLHMRSSLVVMINSSLSTGKSPGEGRTPTTPANFRSDIASSRGAFRLGQPAPALTHRPQFPQQPVLQMVNRIPTPQRKSSPLQEAISFYDTSQQHQTYPSQYPLTPNRHAPPQVYHSTPQNRDPQFYTSTPRQNIVHSRSQIEMGQHQPQNFMSPPRVVTSYSPAHQNSVRSAVVSSRNGPIPTGPSSMSSPYSRGPSSRGGQGNGIGTTGLNVRPMRGRNDFVGSLPAHGGRRRG